MIQTNDAGRDFYFCFGDICRLAHVVVVDLTSFFAMKFLPFILCVLVPSCTTTTTYHQDGGKVVVKQVDDRLYLLASKGIELIAYQYKIEAKK